MRSCVSASIILILVTRYSWIFSLVFFAMFTTISITLNSWFDIFRHAFSDLGGPRANYPWIYNTGLIISSIPLLIFSTYLINVSSNKIETIGASYLVLSSMFLALIGVYPSGTQPHIFVTTCFFILAYTSFLIHGLGVFLRGKNLGLMQYAIFFTGLIIGLIIEWVFKWPSAALLETYAIIIIVLMALVASYTTKK